MSLRALSVGRFLVLLLCAACGARMFTAIPRREGTMWDLERLTHAKPDLITGFAPNLPAITLPMPKWGLAVYPTHTVARFSTCSHGIMLDETMPKVYLQVSPQPLP